MLDAFRLTAVKTRDELHTAAKQLVRGSPERALLDATVMQCDGDVDGAIRLLRYHIKSLTGAELAAAADTLAPILVMRHENAGVVALADVLELAGWNASAYAFRALAAADSGKKATGRRNLAAALNALEQESDEVVRSRVLQRAARAAYYLDDHERAVDLALACAQLASNMGAWRLACAAYSIAYNVYHAVIGDVVEADRYARLCHEAAAKSKDESFTQGALGAEYELAVQLADDGRIKVLERQLHSRLLPQQYTERFALALSHAMVRGTTDLVEMRTLLQVLRETPGRSDGQWALCAALIAVTDAANAEDDRARDEIRAAIARLGRPTSNPAYERRYRRLARASAAAACALLGDDVRAARIVSTKESREGEGEERLPELMRSGGLAGAPIGLRGIARIFAAAFALRRQLEPPAGLTVAEVDVLRLLGRGWTAGKIARETGRSVNTVYNHTRSILSKLESSRASEAVAKARERGFLT